MNGAFDRQAVTELFRSLGRAPDATGLRVLTTAFGDGSGLPRPTTRAAIEAARQSEGGTAALRGDHDLNPDMLPRQPLRPAAVLVPLVDRDDGLTVLLTQRTEHLPDHAGQVSFPGGRVETHDADVSETALRETEEEVGLHRRHVELVGTLDLYVTRTGYSVQPVVGVVAPPFELAPDPSEVAAVFEVPLAFFSDPASRRIDTRRIGCVDRRFYAFPWQGADGEHYIWGATAGMLVNLCEILDTP